MAAPWDWDDRAELVTLAELDSSRHKEWFEEYLVERADAFPEVEWYLEHGSWRNKDPLTEEEEEEVSKTAYNQQQNQCYYNTQTALLPDVDYVEGYAVGRTALPHAWLEINGKVAEITPTVDRSRYDYYGAQIDNSRVRNLMIQEGKAIPIVEDLCGD